MLTTQYVPGAPNWLDLGAPDIDAAAAFYGAVFGWTFRSAGPDAGGYGFFQLDGKTVAGAGPLTEEGARPAWTVHFHTPDVDALAKSVEQAGGTVRFGPCDVFTAGRLAGFTDPAGAEFAAWQPGDTPGLEVVGATHTLCWTELYTTDAAAAKSFYRSVFSWETVDKDMGGNMIYTIASPAGTDPDGDAGHAGIMQMAPETPAGDATPEWHPYFAVEDCDAIVAASTERGATALLPPADAEGVGRLAMLRDPFGAVYAVIKPSAG
ncbi:VOC family protein [Streptomyces albofaciens JCM 4342]|uniref:VOC family protein n=1 Tax=Streptomyces albofaciens TaxID=66866 RepID=UPI00123B0E1F|nr:VOC family protein [Streptomyces albofaciens]KAA6223251.1 VOC family protein [Streptomyces albofaciens JCM 4342]